MGWNRLRLVDAGGRRYRHLSSSVAPFTCGFSHDTNTHTPRTTPTGADATANLLGVQEAPKAASEVHVDFSNLLGPLFFTWVVQMLLPIFLMQLVYEKEHRLRMMMKMHGLGDGAYWLVTYTWFAALYAIYMAVFVAFGSLIGLNMFTKNSMGVQVRLG